MASSSGTKNNPDPPRSLSRRMTKMPTRVLDLPAEDEALDVPSCLASIAPIFRVANEIEKENPRVAYLCRFHGFEKAHTMDPTSSGRGVRQFKTHLLHRLEKEEEETRHQLAKSDTKEILYFYHQFYRNNILEGEYTKKPEEMARIIQIATVLYDVLKTVVPQPQIDQQTQKIAEDVKRKREQYVNYNILPLYTVGVKPAIMELPEIKAALHALQNVNGLPMPIVHLKPMNPDDKSTMPTERIKPVNDILDWLSSIFGFQKGNVANQREHLILLLANMDVRHRNLENYTQLNSGTVQHLMEKIFKNYRSWFNYLHCKSNLKFPQGSDRQQLELIYIGLYLLIWGEASNIRFMPECLCYIFHQMANEVYGILYSNVHPVSGETYQTTARDEESFLRDVVTPIYQVLYKEAKRNKNGKASHSRWRNYDDLNEYFWSDKCFRLGWPMDPKADFFRHSDGIPPANERTNQAAGGRRKPKTNFVEVRTFWHLYRSFDRMWIFFILAFQAMVIVAWSSSGSLTAFFDADVFRSVLSIFITYAFLNLLQATLDIVLSWNAWKSLNCYAVERLRVVTMKKLAFLGCWILLLASILAVDSKSDGLGEWHILTKQNFSSQIRLHPHILLIVTLPWSGESQSFMKDVARLVTDRPEEFSSLKLMLMHRNTEKLLVEAIGATTDAEETTVLYYHHSVSYKYRGRLRPQNVLSSLRPYVSIEPEELLFKSLTTPEDLKAFLDSTDKALLLFEFCEWSSKLLAKRKMNGTDRSGFGVQGDPIGLNFSVEANRSPAHLGKNNQKGMETANMKCGVDYGLGGVPWLGGFSSVNDSASLERSEKMSPGVASFCTRKEYQLFDSFFSKFMTVAREFFLPPERHKFGLVSERSMLSNLGVEDSGSWLAVLYFSGCPSCSKVIKKEDDLKNALQMDNLVVTELEGDGNTLQPAFPANQPSVLLFVDRSSELSETRIKCKEALDAFRELALHYLISQQVDGQPEDKSEMSKVEDYHALRSKSGHPKLKLSQAAQMIKLKDKMSNFMIVNEGKQVTLDKISLDLQGSSLKEILDIVLKQKKKAKLSSLAKELGFQLLSDDMDIKLVNTMPVRTEVQSDQHTQELSKEATITSSVDSDKDQFPQGTSISAEEHLEISEVTGSEISFQNDEEKTAYVDTSKQFLSVDSEQNRADHKLDTAEDLKVEEEISSRVDKSGEQQLHFQGFKGSFFFSDGNDRLLHALTGGSKVPAVVIVDPVAAQHHVLSEETNLSYSSLADFLAEFVNGSLLPYQQSESVLHRSREATQPPFVNLDFHQVDTIPQVTSRTFSELVIGFNQSDTDAWNKDVLVLFSNRWCGFCQRMELVVREVYRSMKDYVKMLKSGSKNEKTMFHDGDLKDVMLKLPFIYLLDCTLNDCSLILKSMNQREVYPALVLFPAEKKNVLPYEGDMAVTEIFKFMADHGSNSHHLISEKGILWTVAKKRGRNQNFFKVQLSDIHEEGPIEKDTLHEVLLTKTHKQVIRDDQAKSHTSQGYEAALRVVTGSILVATDKLTVHPFDKSEILIVKADQVTGFQGLIINKHIRWDALNELEQGLEMLAEAPLSFGGPLIKGGMPLVALTRRFVKTEYPEVLQGVFFLDQLATIQKIKELKSGNQSVSDYWFFFGYSSWGWDQLFDEIAEGAWNLSDDGLKHLEWPLG